MAPPAGGLLLGLMAPPPAGALLGFLLGAPAGVDLVEGSCCVVEACNDVAGMASVEDDTIVLEDLGVSLLVGTPGCGGSVLGRTDGGALELVEVVGGAVGGTTLASEI